MIRIDEEILNKLKNNDKESFSGLIDKYSSRLKRASLLIVKDENLAEDIVQETFIKLFYNINQFKGNSSLYTYIYRIMVNECRQKMRKNWFKRVITFDKWFIKADIDYSIEKVDRLAISQCIMKLSRKHREVILLHYYEDMSVKDMSIVLDEKEGTIKSRLSRARANLKIHLKKAGFEYE